LPRVANATVTGPDRPIKSRFLLLIG
jgi:hypothetical protein